MDPLFRKRQIDLEVERLLGSLYADTDDAAIENEAMFSERFGFDCSRFWRKKVVEFKRKRDLTDRDIRALYRNGTMTFGNGALEISSLRVMPVLGWLQLAAAVPAMLHLFLLAFCVAPPRTVGTLLAVTAFAAVYGVAAYSLYWFYVAPARTWRRHIRDWARSCVAPLDGAT